MLVGLCLQGFAEECVLHRGGQYKMLGPSAGSVHCMGAKHTGVGAPGAARTWVTNATVVEGRSFACMRRVVVEVGNGLALPGADARSPLGVARLSRSCMRCAV